MPAHIQYLDCASKKILADYVTEKTSEIVLEITSGSSNAAFYAVVLVSVLPFLGPTGCNQILQLESLLQVSLLSRCCHVEDELVMFQCSLICQ